MEKIKELWRKKGAKLRSYKQQIDGFSAFRERGR